MVVVDELYVDYLGQPSLAREIADQPNLVVVRSLSKEYSLAGERCGITLGHPEVIGVLRRIMPPYPLTVTAIRAIDAAISPAGMAYGRRNIARIVAERDRVREALSQLPAVVDVFPSATNFLLLHTEDPRRLCVAMAEHGIKLRDRSSLIDGAVRVSIGTPSENDELLQALKQYA